MAYCEFATAQRRTAADAIAPDGSEVRALCGTPRGGMAEFVLPPGAVAKAVVHRTVDELWYVLRGTGQLWRASGQQSEVVALTPGLSLSIPVAVRFQFRCDGPDALVVLGVTMPPWPGAEEAVLVEGAWEPAGVG
jgi:mannose-6-phosphate isomerase-like protein (cupin superfamily)